ncbi:hypothetical protein Aca07nite_32480 [Actinoplanes capillaceus]|uniref:Uncharacterized protein n=1 Tax=Actinoplanes campanulatus TaxID=113559 RepID=A0ABQ3WI96_9ACTN|nr:hypothetical protein [Actinoplanes capillaceus]GID45973.1 hypothetical protein Aca07nite_32480 [Actinoplanes capillaceus]
MSVEENVRVAVARGEHDWITLVEECAEDTDVLWLETPDVEAAASVGKHGTLDEAERMFGVLADEDRAAVRDLPDVISRPW